MTVTALRYGASVDDLLQGLDATQRDAVTSTSAPLAILAGAGSGKTRVLTRRIAWQANERITDPRHVLAVTFTRKAAGELRTRLGRLGVQQEVTAGTFHAIALAQLRRRVEDGGRTMPTLLERKVRLLLPLMGGPRGREAALAAADVASEIEWAKARLVTPDRYAHAATSAGRNLPRPADQITEIFKGYEREKRKRGLVDFDDLISGCADAFERDPEFAAAQRWRFRHLYVDEFQDASPSQFRLLRAWLGEGHDLCVVGDGDQAIYGFAGADPSFLTRFEAHFPPRDHPQVGVVRLGSNYRSSPQVVGAATSVLGSPNARRPAVHAARPDGPLPTIDAFDDDQAEATEIAKALQVANRDGVRWSRMAVLYRTNAQSAQFE
jgi:DNA helicase II / ATP-dependent DNA helicase PcrA